MSGLTTVAVASPAKSLSQAAAAAFQQAEQIQMINPQHVGQQCRIGQAEVLPGKEWLFAEGSFRVAEESDMRRIGAPELRRSNPMIDYRTAHGASSRVGNALDQRIHFLDRTAQITGPGADGKGLNTAEWM